ncbi:MAG TPA: PAS domain-containing protein [Burkholderiaceae bacterium]|nr:PAS domain-containing protein [Burkholderiaceae bacterium]
MSEQSPSEDPLRLALAIEAAGLGVFEYDVERAEPRWDNVRMYELFGRDPARGPIPSAEFLGEVLHPDDAAALTSAFATAVERSGPVALRIRIRRQSDGRWRWLRFNAKAESGAAGPARRIVGVVADVTDEVEVAERLSASELRYRTLFDMVPVGIVLVRADGGFEDFNDAACATLGYDREEFASLDMPTLDTTATREAVLARIAHVRRSTGVVRHDLRLRAKDGSVHDILSQVQRAGPEGTPLVRAIWTDISAQQANTRAVEQLLERQALALEAASMAWWEWSPRDGVAFWSRMLYVLLGLPPGAGLEPVELFASRVHPEDAALYAASMEETLRSERTRTDYRVVRPDGETRWLASRCSRTVDASGAVVRVTGIVVDITERKVLELELLEAARRKDEFLSMLAHELRNPLAPVINALAILGRPGVPDAAARSAVDVIGRQARHLARIVDDLLDAARISRGQIVLRREPVPLAKLLNDAIDVVKPLMESRRQTLRLEVVADADTLQVDPTRITQAIGNLLHNASKFSPADSTIELRATDSRDEVIIDVVDQGAGFSSAQGRDLFELFAQGGTFPMHAEGGLGIGLAVVKIMTELHGGTAEARSEGPNRGARFTMRLPRVVDGSESSRPAPAAAVVDRARQA